ncbi:hypothetical protein N7451_005299 [Penicillium sp. IBT 35674x]|nr:hypothetical protein N7451_005299 [Penicillium sp. IBT 35674x]
MTIKVVWASLISRYMASEEVRFGVTETDRRAAISGIDFLSEPTIATFPYQMLVQNYQPIAEAWRQLHHHRGETVPNEQLGLLQMRKLSSEAANL